MQRACGQQGLTGRKSVSNRSRGGPQKKGEKSRREKQAYELRLDDRRQRVPRKVGDRAEHETYGPVNGYAGLSELSRDRD